MKRRLADWMRRWADRIDNTGAPKRTSWCMTIEDGWGAVFNDRGVGCPLWYYGDADYKLAHHDRTVKATPDDIQWVAVGLPGPEGVHVLGSAEVIEGMTTRRVVGYDLVKVPGAKRTARVPRWEITLTCKLPSFVSVPGASYQDAVNRMFHRAGVRG